MSIETDCPGCSRRLRVSSDAAGGKARCPVCNTIYSVPGDTSRPEAGPKGFADSSWWRLRTPEGRSYGPVSKQELDGWVADGRVTADCLLQQGDDQAWQSAESVYSVLQTVVATVEEINTPLQGAMPTWTSARNPNARHVQPHRGAIILALGIMSWMSCPLFGIFAWAMGTSDLRRMQIGRMDREGRTLTQAGRILGIVHVVLSIVFHPRHVWVCVCVRCSVASPTPCWCGCVM